MVDGRESVLGRSGLTRPATPGLKTHDPSTDSRTSVHARVIDWRPASLPPAPRAGVDLVFGYPGGAIMPFYHALPEFPELRHVLMRHEQAAAHAADGYARASGRPGVCVATSGPGATNLVTGLATAQMDSSPVVAITGQVPRAMIGRDAFQETDIIGITLPITKHSAAINDVTELAPKLREAFAVATDRTARAGADRHPEGCPEPEDRLE